MILSAEDFCFLDSEGIHRIRDYLYEFDIKIIIYLRRQDEACLSLWVECAKNYAALPKVGSFHEWMKEHDYFISRYDYLELIAKWEAVFSQENLILRIFDPSEFSPSLFHDFLDLCGIRIDKIFLPKHTNISPGVKTIEVIRLVKNHIGFSNLDEKK